MASIMLIVATTKAGLRKDKKRKTAKKIGIILVFFYYESDLIL